MLLVRFGPCGWNQSTQGANKDTHGYPLPRMLPGPALGCREYQAQLVAEHPAASEKQNSSSRQTRQVALTIKAGLKALSRSSQSQGSACPVGLELQACWLELYQPH